ncbi:uncharacterized protein Dvir_GJ19806 [Drosophila virilis]|uniref:Reverse transcriptase domain-containing protein n=1 Tax=Drosophila virilis TaxID=7244 RepID=A0A0Q9VY47_DROVI|nr:uncharacterized protein Dvir_GJ19806 [Drosophila virilis]
MQRACDAAMVRKKKGGNKHKPVRWWNGEIEDVRNRCHTARRIYQRDGKQQTWPWSTKPKKLAQPTTPGELCSPRLSSEASGNAGPTRYPAFGQAYKTVMSKLARGPVPTCPEHLKQIVETLLPRQIELAHNPPAVGTSVVLPIDTEDISATLKRIKSNKARDDASSLLLGAFLADDIEIVTVAKEKAQVERKTNEAAHKVTRWLVENGLNLAAQKTEAVPISSRKQMEAANITVDGTKTAPQTTDLQRGPVDAPLRFIDLGTSNEDPLLQPQMGIVKKMRTPSPLLFSDRLRRRSSNAGRNAPAGSTFNRRAHRSTQPGDNTSRMASTMGFFLQWQLD